ncbi:MAG: UDP-N-acetylmuramoyl-L-alanine--D-glutamate ligase [Patescibacteria group bacterium]
MPSPKLENLKKYKIIIFGLGREGLSTYRFLHARFSKNNFILIDDRPLLELDKVWVKLIKNNSKAKFTSSLKELSVDDLRNSVLYKTPGIPVSHPGIKQVLNAGALLSSNTQLFFDLVKDYKKNNKVNGEVKKGTLGYKSPKLTTIGITGTKGKSTASSMLYHVLKENNLEVYLGGNIGTPALENWQVWNKNKVKKAKQQDEVFFILELSCHQLAEIISSPDIAVIQDIVSEHLDYYEDFDQYLQAKSQITRFQTKKDLVIYNADSKTAAQLANLSPGKKITFSLKNKELVSQAKKTSLLGEHNIYNTIPAIIIGQYLKLTPKQISSTIKTFKPLHHRLELIAKINGVKYYDDSISTIPQATIAALKTFAGKSIILLAGGYERQQDFSQLAKEIKNSKVKAIAILPPSGQRIIAELERVDICNALRANIKEFSSMIEAVHHVHQFARPGDIVLLSPAAASFGLFKDYRERGNEFARVVGLFQD